MFGEAGLDYLIEDPISLTTVSDALWFLRRNNTDIVVSAMMSWVRHQSTLKSVLSLKYNYNSPAGLRVWECSPIPLSLIVPVLDPVVSDGGGGTDEPDVVLLGPGVLGSGLHLTGEGRDWP